MAETRNQNKNKVSLETQLEEARSLRLKDFTPRELLSELKERGYKWERMTIVIEKEVDWNKI